MSTATAARLMTMAELLAMPDDGVDRWLIRGQLREKPITVRNRFHSRVLVRIAQLLLDWLDRQPAPHGEVLGGKAGFRIRKAPDTVVGVDVAYVSYEIASRLSDETTLVDGVPTLAVEILSPSDTHEEVRQKVTEYLEAGVALIWVVDPDDHVVRIYRTGAKLQVVNEDQELSGDPHLPGFHVAVRRLFE
jgi:Uma2 family endonuclease